MTADVGYVINTKTRKGRTHVLFRDGEEGEKVFVVGEGDWDLNVYRHQPEGPILFNLERPYEKVHEDGRVIHRGNELGLGEKAVFKVPRSKEGKTVSIVHKER